MQFPIPFTKMSGTGNDFIIIDHRKPFLGDREQRSAFARAVCRRRFSVGADGLILIENSTAADFKWDFYNGDGSAAEMCGNGARCAARFAFVNKIATSSMRFETVAGIIEAQVLDGSVKIKLTDPVDLRLNQNVALADGEKVVHFINTGVPHAVHFVDHAQPPVVDWGRQIRHHKHFQPAGTNANFVHLQGDELLVRTYERGVEDETMACGTGAVASAIIAALEGVVTSPVKIRTSGGEPLVIHFQLPENTLEGGVPGITEVYLEGPAHMVYDGMLHKDTLS